MRKISFVISFLISLFVMPAFAQQWGLYTFYSPQNTSTAYLVDTNGTTFKTWSGLTGSTGYSTYLVKGDTIVRSVAHSGNQLNGGGMTGEVQKITWAGTVVWDFVYSSSTYCLHHDICPMPNGNVLLISYDVKTASQATQAGASSSSSIWSEKIIEVHPTGATTGTIVWEWDLWDHLCQSYSSAKSNYVTSINANPQLMNLNYASGQDRWHMNGLDYNPSLDQIAISMHNMNELYVIDHSTTTAQAATHAGGNSGMGGDFLYRWGNPAVYGGTGTADFNVIHDAHWIPSNNPNYPNYLCGFNNKGGTSSHVAIDIIQPPYNGYNYTLSGTVYGPTAYAYRHTSSYSCNDMGNSQQLPNGNMHICVPAQGASYIYEISPSGTTLWTKTVSGTVPQAYRFDKCFVRGPVVHATASSQLVTSGTAVTLSSTATSVTESSPAYTYQWTSIPSGYTSSTQNPVINPTASATYTVVITNTSIGCADSATVTVNVTSSGIENIDGNDNISVYPNPTTGILNINGITGGNAATEVYICDMIGKVVLKDRNVTSVDMSALRNGVYYLKVNNGVKTIAVKKVILIR